MKNKLWICGIIITIVCVACGVMLPEMTFSYQAKHLDTHAERYSITENQFNYTSTLTDVLASVTQDYYEIEYSEELANMTATEAFDEGLSFLNGIPLDQLGTPFSFEDQILEHSVSCNLHVNLMNIDSDKYGYDSDNIAANSSSLGTEPVANSSLVVWRVSILFDDYSSLEMLIDDQNKKVISLLYKASEMLLLDNMKNNVFVAEYLVSYLEKYYNLSFSKLDCDKNDYYIHMYDSEKREITLHSEIFDDHILFNVN